MSPNSIKEKVVVLLSEESEDYTLSDIYTEILCSASKRVDKPSVLRRTSACVANLMDAGIVVTVKCFYRNDFYTYYKLADPRNIVRKRLTKQVQ